VKRAVPGELRDLLALAQRKGDPAKQRTVPPLSGLNARLAEIDDQRG